MQIFQQPYPFILHKKRILKIAGFIFTIVFIFLLVFRPFNIDETEHRFPYVITSLIQAISSTLIFVIAINGIKRATAEAFAAKGANIVVAARRKEELDTLVA